jgi:hypothetical protein
MFEYFYKHTHDVLVLVSRGFGDSGEVSLSCAHCMVTVRVAVRAM